MSGTTSNYAFPYPTGTDLVRNGATAMQSLADSIDSLIGGSSASGKLFYIAGSDSTSTAQTTSSATYVSKTDCQVTFTTGASGVFAVILNANLAPSAEAAIVRATVAITGATTVSPSVGSEAGLLVANRNVQLIAGSCIKLFDGTPNTSTTVTLNMASSTGTATVNDAFIQVICLG